MTHDARPDHLAAAAHAGHAIRSLAHRMPPGPSGPEVTWAVLGHLRPVGLDLARALRILADRTLDENEGADSNWARHARSHLTAAARLSEQLAGELHLAMDHLQDQVQAPPAAAGRGVRRLLRRG